MKILRDRFSLLTLLGLLLASWRVQAQELEPRAFSPNPTGINFLIVDYGRSSGGVLFDPSIPVTDVDAELNSTVVGYGHTFGFAGRSATASLALPYVWGDISGSVGEGRGTVTRSGLADARLQLSVNLLGGPALSPAEFAQRTPETTLGVSLAGSAPVGQYD